jgi:hypothetical protein
MAITEAMLLGAEPRVGVVGGLLLPRLGSGSGAMGLS